MSKCASCRYWSEMIAKARGSVVYAMCLADDRPREYTSEHASCDQWAYNSFGAVDGLPDYGESARAAYAKEGIKP